ncbi:MAG: RagB/SusD family nutrient uptake outer membrane protein, partial [Bacteroidales bacterium]|nr:RagB/SusD family nutrient uptake outer membrane protein [Bacteroidales bacterium]
MLWTVSCSDFLDEDPKGKLMSNTAFTQVSDLEGAVNVLYREVSRSTFGATQFIDAFMGDDLSTHPASNKGSFREWDKFAISTSNDRLLWCWQDKYLVVKAANFIINGAESTPGATQDEITYALGQAHFWRAWAYFYLVRTFGPLPKVTTIDVDLSIKLSTVSDIYDMIVSDLQEAENLPANYTETPKAMNGVNVVASKGAAQAFLSYVYLTMAGWPLNKGTEYYKLAADEALKVIQGTEDGTYYYSLYDEFWKIHSKAENWHNQECIAAV